METEKKTTKIVLSRSVYNPDSAMAQFDWKVIPAGTELVFDENGVAIFKDSQVFLNRIHKDCVENPSQRFKDNYFPDYSVNEEDEILACHEDFTDRLIISSLGDVLIRDYAFGINDSITLASNFDNSKNWDEIINDANLDIHETDIFSAIVVHNALSHPSIFSDEYSKNKDKVSLIIANKNDLVFRLLSYSFALNPSEICLEDTFNGIFVYVYNDVELFINPIRFGRGKKWVQQQINNLPDVGRNGRPPEIIFPEDDDTLCIYCEVQGGMLLLSPIGKEYGIELFYGDIYKDTDIFYRCISGNKKRAYNCRLTPLLYIHKRD